MFPFTVALLLQLASFQFEAIAGIGPDAAKADSLFGSIAIVRPPALFGAPQAIFTIDGKSRKYQTGPLEFIADVKCGDYDLYSVTADKPVATISVAAGKTLYLVRSNDETGRLLLAALRGRPAGQGELKKIVKTHPSNDAVPDSSGWAEILIVSPVSFFGDEARLCIGDRRKKEAVTGRTLTAQMVPGSYEVFDSNSVKPLTTITVSSGELLYAVARSSASPQRQLGDIFFDNGNRKGALSLYRAALAIDSSTVDIYKRYAELALELAGGSEAITALQRLDRVGESDGQDCQALAGLLAAANRNAEAQQMFTKALSKSNTAPSVFIGLGAVKFKTGDLRGAAAAYENAIRLVPDSAGLYRLAAGVYLRQKDTAKAIASYDMFFKKGGKNTATAYLDGRLKFLRGDFAEALTCLQRVSGATKEKPEYSWMRGESEYRLKHYDKAAPLLARAAAKSSSSPQWTALVEMLLNSFAYTNETAKMSFWVDRYAKSPRRQPATVAYFHAFLKEKTSTKAALALYDASMKKYPGDYRSFVRSGILLSADAKTLGRALELLKKATVLADTVPEAWKALAAVYEKLGRHDDELAALKVCVSADSQDAQANARIGELMLRKGNTGEAIEKLEAAEKTSSADPAVLKALAQGYAAAGKPDSAIAVLRRAKAGSPKDLVIRQRLIELMRKTGPVDTLLAEYKAMLDVRRDTITLTEYARLLFDNAKFAEAQNALEDLRATRPDYVPGLMLLCRVLRAEQKYLPAIDVYKEIGSISPLYLDAMFERAQTHLENGQPYWAELFYQRTLKANPRYAHAELGLAKVAKLRRNHGAYLLHVNRARKLAPEDPVIEQEFAEGGKDSW
jgi:tetratricopeptide (TPR) repeat protein